MADSYPKLMSPASIAGMPLRNRTVLAAMGSNFANVDGSCSERLIAYYEARAKGGAGLLILETSAACWPNGATMPNTVGFSKDEFIPGLRQLADRVHAHGSKIVAQLNHGGKMSQEDTAAGRVIPIPSKVKKGGSNMFSVLTAMEIGNFIKAAGPDGKGPAYTVMSEQDIKDITESFASAAARALKAGLDGVEIHAGHGYLLANFLSPATNKRDDRYGGSRENRARFLLQVIAAIRAATTPDFPILVRLDAKEYRMPDGIELEDCLETSRLCEAAGADAIDVSAYGNIAHAIAFTEAPLVHEPAGFLDFARAVKQVVSIPVIGVGRLEPAVAEAAIARGDMDFLAMGRKLLADPDLPNKLAAGTPDAIRPCIYCYVCVSQIFINQPMCCAVNHNTGREYEGDILASDQAREKVLVVGGGPGGMEAARLLALAGHSVSLWEKERDLGGTARVAALAYEPNERLIDYLVKAVRALPIEIQLGRTASVKAIAADEFDRVIVATGALRVAPSIPGKDQRHVFDGNELRGVLMGSDPTAIAKLNFFQRTVVTVGRWSQLLRNIKLVRLFSKLWMPLARDVVVVGGGLVGLELAEYLVERGRKVCVLEPGPSLGAELSIVRRARVIHQLREHGAELITDAEVTVIGTDTIRYILDERDVEKHCKQVIIAMGAQPDNSLVEQLNQHTNGTVVVDAIGDCRGIGYIEGAILDARKAVQAMS